MVLTWFNQMLFHISPAEVEIQVWKIGIEPHTKMWFNRQNRNLNSKKGFQRSTSFNQRQYGYAERDSIQILGQLGATTRTEFPCQTDLLGFLSEYSMPGHITYISQTGGRNRDPKGGTPIRQTLHTKENKCPFFHGHLSQWRHMRNPYT